MRALALLAVLFLTSTVSAQDIYVGSHLRYNAYGQPTFVQGHYRTQADGYQFNNYSSYPILNPYTGSLGTHHYPSYGSSYPSYGSGYSTPHTYGSHYGGGIHIQHWPSYR